MKKNKLLLNKKTLFIFRAKKKNVTNKSTDPTTATATTMTSIITLP